MLFADLWNTNTFWNDWFLRQLYHNPRILLNAAIVSNFLSWPCAYFGPQVWPQSRKRLGIKCGLLSPYSAILLFLYLKSNSSPFFPTVWAESNGKIHLYSGFETLHYYFGSHPMRWMRVVHLNWGVNNLNLLLWWKEKDSVLGTHKVLQNTLVFFRSTCKWSCSGR